MPSPRPVWIWLETLSVTIVAVVLGYWVNPLNPLMTDAQFPWVLLAPVLLALRYGVLPGVGSALLLLITWLAGLRLGLTSELDFPKFYFLGGLLLTMLVGEYSGLWRTRLRRVEEVNEYLDQRLEELTYRHYLLRLSHDKLEQNLISKPATLRDGLIRLRDYILKERIDAGSLAAAQEVLAFLAQFCQLETAGIYPALNRQPAAQAVAHIGNIGDLDLSDPLLIYALGKAELSHVRSVDDDTARVSRYIVVAPLRTSLGQILGVLAIEKMPFFALNEETLQTLSVLVAYYADTLIAGEAAAPIREVLPDCPPDFADEVLKLSRIQRDTGIESYIVALVFGRSARQESLFSAVNRMQRGLDISWEIKEGRSMILLTLMPLAGRVASEGYLARIENAVSEQFDMDFTKAQIKAHTTALGSAGAVLLVQDLLATCRAQS